MVDKLIDNIVAEESRVFVSDPDLGLGGYGTDEWATSDASDGMLLGDPVECGGEGCGGDWAPPVIVYRFVNSGSGSVAASRTKVFLDETDSDIAR